MTIDDFEQVHSLWMEIHGFGIRSIDDSKEGVERFIRRNPATSMVAVCDGKIVGAILCGHDGRRAGLYHVCVQENYRKHGIGQKLVERCLEALKAEKISKVNLIAFKQNEIGNRFWQSLGWKYCDWEVMFIPKILAPVHTIPGSLCLSLNNYCLRHRLFFFAMSQPLLSIFCDYTEISPKSQDFPPILMTFVSSC